jgi:hypothetical protein
MIKFVFLKISWSISGSKKNAWKARKQFVNEGKQVCNVLFGENRLKIWRTGYKDVSW